MADARELRGREIDERFRIIQDGTIWRVPSQYGAGRYIVRLGNEPTCSCEDYTTRQLKCKHIYAVEFSLTMPAIAQSEPVSTTVSMKRKTYKQDWPSYNAAQVNEHRHFRIILNDLCSTIPAVPAHKVGRPSVPVRDAIFSACLKVYSLMSARRFSGELEEAQKQGYIQHKPHFNSVLNVFDKEETTPILRAMIETSALPLRSVESAFAVDSTGFATIKYASWFDEKYNTVRRRAKWVKAHFVTGVKTNVVSSVEIHDQNAGDCPQLPSLIGATSAGFKVDEVSADAAYLSNENFAAVDECGGTFFPLFKRNTVAAAGGLFGKAFHWFQFNRDDYLAHYHRRSNVESTVSMVKRKFGDGVRAKNELAQRNEVYAKFVCHNICVLIAEMYALGIQAIFEKTEVG